MNLWRQWFNNLQRAAPFASFWRQWFNNLQRTALLTSLVQYDRILGQQQLFMVNYACGFNQLETGKYFEWIIISNYWMRLSRMWRILQVEESAIHRGRSPRCITPSEICRILHIQRKPNSIVALLFIQNIFFAQTCKLYSRPFLSLLNDTILCPGFLGQWLNNLWRQWFNNLQRAALLTSLVQYDRIRGQQQLFMLKYACGFNK